jgi:cytochrome c oxidase cbb3-type subunit IV
MSPTVYGWVAGIATLTSMLAFIGVVLWSYSRRRRSDFDAASRLPLEEDVRLSLGEQR